MREKKEEREREQDEPQERGVAIHQNIDSVKAGDSVEITVGGDDQDAWAFDGCVGLVLRAGHNGKQQIATVQIRTGARQGTRVFPVASLRKR